MDGRGVRIDRGGSVLLVLVVLVAAVGGVSGVAGAQEAAHAASQHQGVVSSTQAENDADSVTLRADVQSNGSANWQIEYRFRLETENDTAAFEQLEADIEEDPSAYLDGFESRIGATVVSAENATGREMTAESFDVGTETRQQFDQRTGVVVYSFRWTNFAEVDGLRLHIGDALAGLFLDEDTSLVVSWPAEYTEVSVDPSADDREEGAAIWHGERDFGPGQPTLVVSSAAPTTASQDGSEGGLPMTAFGVAGLFAVALVGGYVLYRRGRTGRPGGPRPADPPDAPAVTMDSGGGDETADADELTGPTELPDDPPEELLSNEERVLRFLREQGGRVKQQEVVSGLDWTAAKTSQVIKGMREAGSVEVFRLGRENVIHLPQDDAGDDTADEA